MTECISSNDPMVILFGTLATGSMVLFALLGWMIGKNDGPWWLIPLSPFIFTLSEIINYLIHL